jgi:hypothetical protein
MKRIFIGLILMVFLVSFLISQIDTEQAVQNVYGHIIEPWFRFMRRFGRFELWSMLITGFSFVMLFFGIRFLRLVPGNPAVQLKTMRVFGLLIILAALYWLLWSLAVWGSVQVFESLDYSIEGLQGDIFKYMALSAVAGAFIGFIVWWWVGSEIEPSLAQRYSVDCSVDGFSDIRDLEQESFPMVSFYRVTQQAAKKGAVMLGFQSDKRLISISLEQFKKNNFQVVGAPGAGKGVFAQQIFAQIWGDVKSFVFDPKEDPYLTGFFREKGAHFIDLRTDSPQLSIFDGAEPREVANCLIEGFSLKAKGAESDVYAVEEQEAIKEIVSDSIGWDFESLNSAAGNSKARKSVASFKGLSRLESLSGSESLESIVQRNKGVYVVFDESDETQKLAAKLIFSRLNQLKKSQKLSGHITVFADEFFHLVNRTSVNALGLMRSFGMNFIIAHQSIGDFEDKFSDIEGKAALKRTMDNTQIKIVYRQGQDAKFWSEQTGFKTFDEVQSVAESNEVQGAVLSESARISVRQRALFDENDFLMLGESVAVVIGANIARKVKTIHPEVKETGFTAAPCGLAASADCESKDKLSQSAPAQKVTKLEVEEFEL